MSLINALKSYKQCDEDGVMCEVSRQTVDEAIERIEKLEAENERLRLALKRIAPSACPKCGDRAVQQIARDALRDIDAVREGE